MPLVTVTSQANPVKKTTSTGTWNHTQALPPKKGSVCIVF